jgi:hypothetical protein
MTVIIIERLSSSIRICAMGRNFHHPPNRFFLHQN